jgi:hypothetical protein
MRSMAGVLGKVSELLGVDTAQCHALHSVTHRASYNTDLH